LFTINSLKAAFYKGPWPVPRNLEYYRGGTVKQGGIHADCIFVRRADAHTWPSSAGLIYGRLPLLCRPCSFERFSLRFAASPVIPLPANEGKRIGWQPDSAESIDAMSTSTSSQRAAPSHDAYALSEAKRRKVRKGTHSCWECKRRKMKCIFDPLTNATTTCNGCRRRGSQCVSQEFPEVVSFSVDDTLTTPPPPESVETRYAGRDSPPSDGRTPTTPASEDGRRADDGIPIPTPVSMATEPSQHLAFYTSFEVRMPDYS
jgi:Fungal Zn(2)-Cys(6) binuclear cluster domain